MEPVVNKLQEGVKYPRFERDATKTINDLVEHITKERGIYSSSIEPNPNEHNIWFNTDTNTLMIYNNHVWRDFNGSGGSSGWSVENALLYRNEEGDLVMDNIKDKTFYILDVDADSIDYIKIANLPDDIEFYIFISSMLRNLYFVNSNIITNYDTLLRHTNLNGFFAQSVLVHKIGINAEFSIINDKSGINNSLNIYNTKLNKVYMAYYDTTGNSVKTYEAIPVNHNNGINQIEIQLPSNIQGINTSGSFVTDSGVQIVYPPFKYETSSNDYQSNICVFRNPLSSTELKVLSSLDNLQGISEKTNVAFPPYIGIFDRFNPDNFDTICSTLYFDKIDDYGFGLIIKDNWFFDTFGQKHNFKLGLNIIIDDFPINKDNDFFNNNSVYCCNSLIINNSSDDDKIKSLIERIVQYDFEFTNYNENPFDTPTNSLIYTTKYKSKYIGIPHNDNTSYENTIMLIIIANKLRNDTEIIYDDAGANLDELGNILIVTIPENIAILKNLIDTNEYSNITINNTLTVESEYDTKGLIREFYHYSINDIIYEYSYERYDTPVIA